MVQPISSQQRRGTSVRVQAGHHVTCDFQTSAADLGDPA